MSADLLRARLTDDLQAQVDYFAALVIEGRQMQLDELRFHQGFIAGLREAKTILEARARDLHAIG